MEALGATFDENKVISCAYFKTVFLLNNGYSTVMKFSTVFKVVTHRYLEVLMFTCIISIC